MTRKKYEITPKPVMAPSNLPPEVLAKITKMEYEIHHKQSVIIQIFRRGWVSLAQILMYRKHPVLKGLRVYTLLGGLTSLQVKRQAIMDKAGLNKKVELGSLNDDEAKRLLEAAREVFPKTSKVQMDIAMVQVLGRGGHNHNKL